MIALIRSEVLRARSRRIVWLLSVTAIAGIVVGAVIAMANSEPPSEAEVQRATARYERTLERCRSGRDFADPAAIPQGYGSIEEYCADAVRLEFFLPSAGIKLGALPEIVRGASFMLGLLGIVLGASLSGADWATGTITTALVWEPRRVRVFVVRAAVAALVVAVVVALLQAFFSLVWIAATSVSGTTDVDDGFWSDVFDVAWRVTAVSVVFAVVAHAVSSLGRSTIAGVGIVVGYAVILEGFVAGFAASTQRWMLIRAATVVVTGEPLLDPRAPATFGPDGTLLATPSAILLTVGGAWLLLAAYVAVIGGAALAAFHRRDVQ